MSKQFPTDLEITKSDGYLGGEPQESACLYLLSAEITGIPQVSLFAVAFYPPAHGEISAPLTCDLLPADCQLQPYTTGSETMAVIRRAASETPYPDLLPPPLPSPLYCLQTSEPLSHCHSFLQQLPSSSAAAESGMQTSRVG